MVPFIPCRNATLEEADALAKEVAKTVGEQYGIPASYTSPLQRLPTEPTWPASARASLREWQRRCRIQRNGLRISDRPLPIPQQASAQWEPRMPLVAYNVNLGTDNLEIANRSQDA